jgi:hypothetical protein
MVALDDALWRLLGRTGRLLTRSLSPVGLDLRRPDGSVQRARPADDGSPTAILSGRPGELILYLMGRQSVAHVEFDGPPAAVAALRAAPFGL